MNTRIGWVGCVATLSAVLVASAQTARQPQPSLAAGGSAPAQKAQRTGSSSARPELDVLDLSRGGV